MWFSKAFVLFFCFFSFAGWGQKPYELVFTTDDYKGFKRNPERFFKDSAALIQYTKKVRYSAMEKGFLTASLDSGYFVDKKYFTNFHLGPKFGNLALKMNSEDFLFFRKHMRISEKFLSHQKFKPSEIGKLMNEMHECLLSTGHPFAKITLKIQEVGEDSTMGFVEIEKYNQLCWSKIIVKGDTAVSESFLANLLQIKPGNFYDETQLKFITSRINQVAFLAEIKPHEVLFTRAGVELYLYIKSKPISSINGFLGLQPDLVKNKYFLTGELNLKLMNVLKRGELLDLSWRSIQTQTQQLQVKGNYPFLFKSPFGLDGRFNLYKRDTTFLDLKSRIALQYYLKGGNYIAFYFERNNSSLLGGATNNTTFNNLGNVKSNNYGISIARKKVDYFPNPSKGINILSSFSVGQRESQISDTSAKINNLIFTAASAIEYFIPLVQRHVLRLANQTYVTSTNNIFQNELIRFGGLLSQRGFNEDELFASTVSIFSFEYRFLLDKNSRLFLFYDQSWYENTSLTYRKDQPFGFGAGLSFGTNIGIFSLQYALGSQQGNPILFKNGKIHFGYIAYF